MNLVRMSDPRPGQKVQCAKCYKMIDGRQALADLDAPAGTFYHNHCVPRGIALPPLTKGMVRQATKTYKTPREWDAYIDLAPKGQEDKVTGKERIVVRARSRDEAFERVRDAEVQYSRAHPRVSTVGRGVAHSPRLSR